MIKTNLHLLALFPGPAQLSVTCSTETGRAGQDLETRLMKDLGKTNPFVHGESLGMRLHYYSQLESRIAPKL